VFEGKISAGTAISMTTRDTARLAEGLDGGRLASYFHTAGGCVLCGWEGLRQSLRAETCKRSHLPCAVSCTSRTPSIRPRSFYIAQCLVVASFYAGAYYLAALALPRLDAAIAGSATIFLLGEVAFLQWWMQLGLTSVLPLAALYALEAGPLTAAWRLAHAILTFGPAFYMFEIQTKASLVDGEGQGAGRRGLVGCGI
jgi:hypothetical protein